MRSAFILAAVSVAAFAGAHAQAPAVTFGAARRDTIAAVGGVATAAFHVANASGDTARLAMSVRVPPGWRALGGAPMLRVPPGGGGAWLVTVAPPSNAAAGVYVIRASATGEARVASDSVVVRLGERRAIELLVADIPGWAVAASPYDARFIARNRGNVTATLVFTSRTTHGERAVVSMPSVTLAPGSAASIAVRVDIGERMGRSVDDVLELIATDAADPAIRAVAAARTTIVMREGLPSDRATLPASLAVRAGASEVGIAPVVLAGSGPIAGASTFVDFAFHAPAAGESPFSDNDVYQLSIRSDRFTLRVGDNSFGFTPLTARGATGFGIQLRGDGTAVSGGGFVQRSRTTPDAATEIGAFIGTPRTSNTSLALTAVRRAWSAAPGVTLSSVSGVTSPWRGGELVAELAVSDSSGTRGTARRARVTGTAGVATYDVGYLLGSRTFAGSQRGAEVSDMVLTTALSRAVSFRAAASRFARESSVRSGTWHDQAVSRASIGTNLHGVATIELTSATRHDAIGSARHQATQRGVRTSALLPAGPLLLTAAIERGASTAPLNPAVRAYVLGAMTARMELPGKNTVSVFAAHDNGSTLGGDGNGSAAAGATVDIDLPLGVTLDASTAATLLRRTALDPGSAIWLRRLDARIDVPMQGDRTLGLRLLRHEHPRAGGRVAASAIYLELRTPIAIPAGRVRQTGRVDGRVVDANTGAGIGGALVHVGDQAAVTDGDGRVRLAGLRAGRHAVHVHAGGSMAGQLIVGDDAVHVREGEVTPAAFTLAVTRGARIRAIARRLAYASTLGADRDSLVDTGPLGGVIVVLQSSRDTLYRTSDALGRIDFGSVAPGRWGLAVLPGQAIPSRYDLESARVAFTVNAGEGRDVELRLVPKRRAVTLASQDRK